MRRRLSPPTYKESPTQYKDTDGWKVAQPQDAMLKGKWWEIYQDPELNALEDKLNIDNQTIKQYFYQFMEARTLIFQARSQLYPTVSFGPGYSAARSSANTSSTQIANSNGTTTTTGTGTTTGTNVIPTNKGSYLGTLPFEASWEPDLWGKVRNTISEYQYAAQVSAAELENERLTEEASLAAYYFELRGQDALQSVYDQTVEADKKSLDYTKAQYETGVGQQISVVEAQNTLQNAQANAANVGVLRAQYQHAIAVLIGTNPSTFSIPVRALKAEPPAVPIGIPSQLLERRPDIAASERTMAQANAEIGVATAAFYPDLTISAEGGIESSSFKHLLDLSSFFWSVGPGVSETIFDAGLRRATVNQYIETYNADVASYRSTVLTAFQQVEDYLAALRIQSQQLLRLQEAVKSAQQYVDLETARYQTGIDPYVNLVTAQLTLLNDQQQVTTLKTTQMTSSVQLIAALGGGWDKTQLPTPQDVSKKLTKAETAIQK